MFPSITYVAIVAACLGSQCHNERVPGFKSWAECDGWLKYYDQETRAFSPNSYTTGRCEIDRDYRLPRWNMILRDQSGE
jgi:hypothetical protein